MNERSNQDALKRAQHAKDFLASDVWLEAWDAYRSKLLSVIETADSNDVATIQNAKRLMTAGQAAKAHLERLVTDGRVAAESIEFAKREKRWFERIVNG